MHLTEQNYRLLKNLIIEAVHWSQTEKAEQLKNKLSSLKDNFLLDSAPYEIHDKIDEWIKSIEEGEGGLSKENAKELKGNAAAAEAFIKMFSRENFRDAINAITSELGGVKVLGDNVEIQDMFLDDAVDYLDKQKFANLGEAYGGSLGGDNPWASSGGRNLSRLRRPTKKVPAGQNKGGGEGGSMGQMGTKTQFSSKELQKRLLDIFNPPKASLGGAFGIGMGNQKLLAGLSNSIVSTLLNLKVSDLFEKIGSLARQSSGGGSISGSGEGSPSGKGGESPTGSADESETPAKGDKPKSKAGKRELSPVEQRMASELNLSVKSGKNKAMRDVIDWLIQNKKLDANALQEALRRGRTKIIINESTQRVRIVNY
jgi:hypothetical protein